MIGHLREKLEELGIADNTIIIFSTDHGIHHGEHGLGGKCFLYQEDLRIPLVIYDPRLASYRIKSSVDDYYLFLDPSHTEARKVVYEELFHLAQDPYEEENLAAASEHAQTLAYFRGRIQEMVAERIVPDTAQRVCKNTNEVYIFEEEKGYYPVG